MNAAVNAIRQHNQRQMMTAIFKIIQRSPSMIRAPQVGTLTQTQQFSSQQQREMDEAILSELVKQLSLITQQISIQQQREMNEAILSELVKQLSLITQQFQQQSVMNEAIPSEQVTMENKQQKPHKSDKTINHNRQRPRHNNNQQKWTDLPVESESTRHPKQQLETQQHPDQQESYTKTGQTLEETILQMYQQHFGFEPIPNEKQQEPIVDTRHTDENEPIPNIPDQLFTPVPASVEITDEPKNSTSSNKSENFLADDFLKDFENLR